jgi:hypothetical protein
MAEASIADVAVCLVAALVFLGLTISRGVETFASSLARLKNAFAPVLRRKTADCASSPRLQGAIARIARGCSPLRLLCRQKANCPATRIRSTSPFSRTRSKRICRIVDFRRGGITKSWREKQNGK